MKQLELNIVESFRLAKIDIIQLQDKVIQLSQNQGKLLERIDSLNSEHLVLTQRLRELRTRQKAAKTITKVVAKKSKKIFLASREAGKFHIKNCPFAQNIKPKSKVIFKTKTSALNKGYKPCKCIK